MGGFLSDVHGFSGFKELLPFLGLINLVCEFQGLGGFKGKRVSGA